MDVALLANPAARAGRALPVAARAAGLLRARGIRTSVISGGSAAESTALLRSALDAGTDAIVVAGGDGTVNLALQEIAGSAVPLGIIPAGTGNDFAAALGIAGIDAAVNAIAAGTRRAVDLARATRTDGSDRLFGTVLASGLDSRVNDRANLMRWPRGHRRYDIALLREFVALRTTRFRLSFELADGTSAQRDESLLIAAVANGRSYGGGIPIAPDADLDDGLLDLVLVRPLTHTRLARLVPRLYRGTHTTAAEVEVHRVRAVTVDAVDTRGYADGDAIGSLPLTVAAVPHAVEVFTSRRM